MSLNININLTRRLRRRKLKDGTTVEQTRYVLNWRDPRTGEREQRFFERQREAQERRSEFLAAYERGVYSSQTKTVTVETAVAAWLETKRGVVRPITFTTYKFQSRYVVGPLAPSEARRAIILSGVGAKPKARAIELLGRERVQELTTRRIRAWHKLISDEVSIYCANKAMQILKAALALAAEDHEFRPPAMPMGLQRQRDKARKMVLTPDEVSRLLVAAREDLDKGVYVAFPFLAGTRPSEQLGLMWDDVDFEANVIHVRRIQMRDGSLSEFTKTAAGVRSIPISPLLREMLLTWRVRCPRKDVKLERVFPAPGVARAWPLPRVGGGGAFIYGNFRRRYWVPTLKGLGLPAVTPHSARHSFISTLQAQGVEVGLVAKLAGHKNAVVTLSHYTHAMRGGEDAVKALDRAYAGSAP
jgi:integrase